MTHVDPGSARPEGAGASSRPPVDVTLVVVALGELRTAYPVSELLGRAVTNEVGQEIGHVDDLMVEDDRLAFAILSVGGFLGIGEHKVVVSFDALLIGDDEVVLPGATKEALKEMTAYDRVEVRKERNPLPKSRRGRRDASETPTSAAGEPVPAVVADVADGGV